SAELLVPGQETIGDLWRAQPLEVHREERDVGEDVAVAEPVIELDAVEETRPARQAEDVTREEVAVAVTNVAGRRAAIEKPSASSEIAPRQRAGLLETRPLEDRARVDGHLREVCFEL